LQVKIWQLPVDASTDPVCNPSTTLCIGDRAVELVLWNPVAENVLALASQQSVKVYDVEQQAAAIGNLCIQLKQFCYELQQLIAPHVTAREVKGEAIGSCV